MVSILINILKWLLLMFILSLILGASCGTIVPITMEKICRRFNLTWKGSKTLMEMLLGGWLYFLLIAINLGFFTGGWGLIALTLVLTPSIIATVIIRLLWENR